ncbi:heat-inducible transcriptional repressor HrcA [Gryllotalpicola protaetiae]|uniref:Heat-inducible transcription repressor HrcA n=1 Tax=Gryllotalpicola protaetiae TaxID=2419771 RepID=A0A387BR89_9MICO|nr:heat-inducible transcriptional repressor HrcA [Gryllotalpicola protaetiae]AYG05092.1 heat-inducible transcriptional repressor HrcA [Gryllotalpicola protaetiae]
MVSERGLAVLRAIVQDYVSTREPVGSKSIVDKHRFGVSAATIRNDMALLEDEELIAAPHTSSGRVPTDKGYRVFVDQLTDVRPLTSAQRHAVEIFLGASVDIDDVLARTVRALAQLTHQVALIQYPSVSRARIQHLEFVALAPRRVLAVLIADTGVVEQRVVELAVDHDDAVLRTLRDAANDTLAGMPMADAATALPALAERFPDASRPLVTELLASVAGIIGSTRQERLIMAGTANLVRTEHDFTGSIYPIMEAIEEQVELLKLFGEMAAEQHGVVGNRDVSVSIGRENEPFGLAETSVLTTGYGTAGGAIARLGVLGPTRMDYSTNMAAVRAVARYLSRALGDQA